MALGVLGLLTITAIPTTIGVSQAVSAQKKQNAAEKERAKFKLAAVLPDGREAFCVLTDGKVRRWPRPRHDIRAFERAS